MNAYDLQTEPKEINPAIILASGSGYGQSGPYRDFPAMDLTVQAMSGIVDSTGFPDQPPVKSGAAVADFFGGVHLFGAIGAALYHREKSGQGSYIDVAMMEAVFPSLASNIGGLLGSEKELPSRTGNKHGGLSLCPYNVFKAKDGYVAILGNGDHQFKGLLRSIEREDLIGDERFADMAGRVARMEEVDSMIEKWSSQLTRDEVCEKLIAHRVPCAPVKKLKETIRDKHLHERGMLMDITHPQYGNITVPRSPIRFVGTEQPEYVIAPTLAQHSQDVFCNELGLTEEEFQQLSKEGVI